MSRKRKHPRTFLDRVKELFFGPHDTAAPKTQRRLRFEGLENRQLMAADVGIVSGHVYRDANGSGKWDAGELGLDQVTVQLYRDNGDGVFQAGTDTLVTSLKTNASGVYSFGSLDLGDYFLRRPVQVLTAGNNAGLHLTEKVSGKIHVDSLKTAIDDFDTPLSQTAAADTTNDNTPATSVAGGLAPGKTIGGEREILTNFTGNAEGPGILASARVANINLNGKSEGLLLLDATSSAEATYTLVWDGTEGIASSTPNLSPGLGGVNLTAGGADHLRIKLNSLDLAGAKVKITVYSDATHFSSGEVDLIPRVSNGTASGNGETDYRFDFDGSGSGGFALGTGALGGADFTKVRGVVMTITVPSDVDARLDMLGAYGSANTISDLAVEEVDLSVNKQVDNATPVVGSLVNYTLTVSNATLLPNGKAGAVATGITVDDTLFTSIIASGKLSFVSDNGGGAFNSSTGVWSIGQLNPGQSKSIIVTMRVNQAALPSVTNTMKIVSAYQPDPDTDDWTDSEVIRPTFVDIAVTKTVDNARPNHNQTIEFTVSAKNLGTAQAQQVKLTDVLTSPDMEDFQLVAVTPSVGTYDSTTGVWTIPTLNAGQTATLKVTGLSVGCDPITNTATLASLGGGALDTNSANNSATATATPRQADLGVTKTVVSNATPSQANPNISFQIVVSNTGPDDATGVVLADQLPAGLTFVSASSAAYSAATGQWNVGTVPTGETRTLTIQARLADGITLTTIGNTASVVTLDQCDENSANDSSTAHVNPQVADLSVTKVVDNASPNLNSNVTFTVTLTNNGPTAATGVSLFDALPSGLSYVSSSVTRGNFDPNTRIWSVGNVGVGETLTFTLVAKVTSTTLQMNTAEVFTADQTDIDSAPNNGRAGEDDIATAVVQPQAIDLSVTKTVNNTLPLINSNVTFTVTVTNSGPNTATGVSLFDALPSGLTYVSSSVTHGSFNPNTRIWSVGNVGVGQTFTFTMVATVTSLAMQMNTVEVFTADQTDVDSRPNSGTAGEDDIASAWVQPQAPIPQGDPIPLAPPLSKRRFLAR
jgi:uncharacterized repeat protein (TIGR01451 family)